ncbi:hypothetical protein E2320_001831 [Naja naja]|nr:hypothetical protein E2320_001831 [Naja naja]
MQGCLLSIFPSRQSFCLAYKTIDFFTKPVVHEKSSGRKECLLDCSHASSAAVPVHQAFSLKAVRALKDAVKECGLHSRFTMGIVQSLSDDTTELLLADWQMLFSMALAGLEISCLYVPMPLQQWETLWQNSFSLQCALADWPGTVSCHPPADPSFQLSRLIPIRWSGLILSHPIPDAITGWRSPVYTSPCPYSNGKLCGKTRSACSVPWQIGQARFLAIPCRSQVPASRLIPIRWSGLILSHPIPDAITVFADGSKSRDLSPDERVAISPSNYKIRFRSKALAGLEISCLYPHAPTAMGNFVAKLVQPAVCLGRLARHGFLPSPADPRFQLCLIPIRWSGLILSHPIPDAITVFADELMSGYKTLEVSEHISIDVSKLWLKPLEEKAQKK